MSNNLILYIKQELCNSVGHKSSQLFFNFGGLPLFNHLVSQCNDDIQESLFRVNILIGFEHCS